MRGDDDDDVRDLFAQANPDAGPDLGISAADIAARGRRVHRRRRTLATAGATVAVIAVTAVLTTTVARPRVVPAGPNPSTQVPITHVGPTPKLSPTADQHETTTMTTTTATTTTTPPATTTLTTTSDPIPTP